MDEIHEISLHQLHADRDGDTLLSHLQLSANYNIACGKTADVTWTDGIFAFRPMFYYGQRSKCADLLNSYFITF